MYRFRILMIRAGLKMWKSVDTLQRKVCVWQESRQQRKTPTSWKHCCRHTKTAFAPKRPCYLKKPATHGDEMFVCTYSAMRSLLQFLSKNKCDSCYMCSKPWNLEKGSAQQTGHAVGYAVKRSNGHRLKWLSSPIVNGKYYVNCRYLHIPIFIGTALVEEPLFFYLPLRNFHQNFPSPMEIWYKFIPLLEIPSCINTLPWKSQADSTPLPWKFQGPMASPENSKVPQERGRAHYNWNSPLYTIDYLHFVFPRRTKNVYKLRHSFLRHNKFYLCCWTSKLWSCHVDQLFFCVSCPFFYI